MKTETGVLIVVVMAIVMAATDSSVVLLAFPDITQTLNTNVLNSIWTILVYMIVTAIATTQLGKVGDVYGRAKIFNIGFITFTIASALCGAAPTIFFLIGFRVLQGIGAAMLMANSGALIADNFPREKLGRPYGYVAAGWGAGNILGIAVGGVLTTLFGWRYIFYINVPIGIVAVYLGFRYLKEKGVFERKFDFPGMILLGASLLLITFDSIVAAAEGISLLDALLIGTGIVLLIAFLYWERRTKEPLIDLSLFSNRVLTFSMFAALFVATGMFSIFFMITLYLQGIVGLTPLIAALLFTPGALIGLFLSPRMGRLSDKVGHRFVATAGVAALAVAVLVYLTLNATDYSPWIVAIASAFSGLGTALFFPANNAAVMSNAQPGYFGSMNGLLRTMQTIGGLLSYVIALYIASASIPRNVAFEVFVGTTQLRGGLTSAFVEGIHIALFGSLALLIVAGVISYARGKAKKKERAVYDGGA